MSHRRRERQTLLVPDTEPESSRVGFEKQEEETGETYDLRSPSLLWLCGRCNTAWHSVNVKVKVKAHSLPRCWSGICWLLLLSHIHQPPTHSLFLFTQAGNKDGRRVSTSSHCPETKPKYPGHKRRHLHGNDRNHLWANCIKLALWLFRGIHVPFSNAEEATVYYLYSSQPTGGVSDALFLFYHWIFTPFYFHLFFIDIETNLPKTLR